MKNTTHLPLGALAWLDVVFEWTGILAASRLWNAFFLEGKQQIQTLTISFWGLKESTWTLELHKLSLQQEGNQKTSVNRRTRYTIFTLSPWVLREMSLQRFPSVGVFTAHHSHKWCILAYCSGAAIEAVMYLGGEGVFLYLQWSLYGWRWGLGLEQACFPACVCCLAYILVIWRQYEVFGEPHAGWTIVSSFFQKKPSFQDKFHAGKLPCWCQSSGAHHSVRCHFAGVWKRIDGDFSSSCWRLCAPFPGSSLPATVTVMAPELLLLMLSHISYFKTLDYRYLNIITVDIIALWDKIKENEIQWGKWPFLCCSGKTLSCFFFLKIIYENTDQIMQLFLAISTSFSWEHYQ